MSGKHYRTYYVPSLVSTRLGIPLVDHHNLDAAFFLAIEDVESMRGLIEFHPMSDDEVRIDICVGDDEVSTRDDAVAASYRAVLLRICTR
jgi:hypothetical protein